GPVVAAEPPLRVEDRLAGHAEIAQISRAVLRGVDEVAERLVALELLAVLLPHFLGKRSPSRKFPARPADEVLRAEAALLDPRQLDEAEVLVLHPVPVRAHVHHAAEARLARPERLLGELELGDVVDEGDRAPRRARVVPEESPGDAHPERGLVL